MTPSLIGKITDSRSGREKTSLLNARTASVVLSPRPLSATLPCHSVLSVMKSPPGRRSAHGHFDAGRVIFLVDVVEHDVESRSLLAVRWPARHPTRKSIRDSRPAVRKYPIARSRLSAERSLQMTFPSSGKARANHSAEYP